MQNYPDIAQLESLLFDMDAALGAIESHGALCGMLCAQGATDAPKWMLSVLGEHEESSQSLQQAGKMLLQIHQTTIDQMNDSNVEFALMIPDDEESLTDRVEALSVWCQGFVYGLAEGGVKEDTELPADSQELIKDILEISRATYSDDEMVQDSDTEETDEEEQSEDEIAFMEVSEYVRMGVLLIYEELQPLQSSQTVH